MTWYTQTGDTMGENSFCTGAYSYLESCNSDCVLLVTRKTLNPSDEFEVKILDGGGGNRGQI